MRGEFDTTGCRYPKKRLQRANPTDSRVLDTVKPVGTHGGVSTGGGLGGLGLSLLGEAREGAGCLRTGGRSPGPLRAALPKFRTLMLDEGVSGPQEERYATQEVPQGFRKVKGAGSPRRRGPALTLATARPAKRPKAGTGQAARSPGFSEGALSRGSSGPGLQAADRSGQKVPPRDSAALGHSTLHPTYARFRSTKGNHGGSCDKERRRKRRVARGTGSGVGRPEPPSRGTAARAHSRAASPKCLAFRRWGSSSTSPRSPASYTWVWCSW